MPSTPRHNKHFRHPMESLTYAPPDAPKVWPQLIQEIAFNLIERETSISESPERNASSLRLGGPQIVSVADDYRRPDQYGERQHQQITRSGTGSLPFLER